MVWSVTGRPIAGLQGRRSDVIIMDEVGLERWDFSVAEARVLAWMEHEFETRRLAAIRGEPYSRGLPYSEGEGRRSGQDQVPECGTLYGKLGVYLEDEPSHLRGRNQSKQLRVRRGDHGRRTQRNQSGRVPASSKPTRHVEEWREAGAGDTCMCCGEPARRGLVRPGYRRTFWYCKGCSYAHFYGSYQHCAYRYQGPQEPYRS